MQSAEVIRTRGYEDEKRDMSYSFLTSQLLNFSTSWGEI
jgi:hypothetical protein